MKYRIKEVTRGNDSSFAIQTKFLFWWIDRSKEYRFYPEALMELEKLTKVSIKYHEVDLNNLGFKATYRNEKGEEIPCPFDFSKKSPDSVS
jgi:hypothetical protein